MCPLQEETSAQAKKEIAKREKERLRLQEKLKKENLEKLRKEQEEHAAADDVGSAGSPDVCLTLKAVCLETQASYSPLSLAGRQRQAATAVPAEAG